MPNIMMVPHHLTKDQAAKLLGLQTYDCALPQPWLDRAAKVLSAVGANTEGIGVYDMLLSSVVWSYDQAKLMGAPHPLTIKAWGYLKALDIHDGTNYVDEADELLNVLDIV
jgi:hypothetical protein